MSCSNILSQIYNTNDIQKTGNDSVDITKGLVVLKATDITTNQIAAFDKDTFEYDLSSIIFESADDSVQLRCFTEDAWAHIEWSALQTHETTQVVNEASASYTELAQPKTVHIVPQADTQFATVQLPYGKTTLTAKIVADDPHFDTEYSVVIVKPNVYDASSGTGTIAQIRDLSFTPLALSDEELPDGAVADPDVYQDISFDRQTNDYTSSSTLYWVNEDVGDIVINLDMPSGVTVTNITYATDTPEDAEIYSSFENGKIKTLTSQKKYQIESAGGDHPLKITTHDSAGDRTYTVTIKKPASSDTSLRKFGYKITEESIPNPAKTNAGLLAKSGSPIGTETTDTETAKPYYGNCGTYYKLLADSDRATTPEKDYGQVQLSADYVRDITELTYYVTPFHKRAKIKYAIAQAEPAASSSEWNDYAIYNGTSTVGIPVDMTANDTSSTTLNKTLFIKVIAEDGTSKIHKIALTKPNANNAVIEAVYVTAKNERISGTKEILEKGKDNTFGSAAALPAAARLLDENDKSGSTQMIDAYTSELTFYVRMTNKNTPVTYSVTAADGTVIASGAATTEETYGSNHYRSFALTGLYDKTNPRYDGDTTITISAAGTDTVFTLRKPDNTITDLRSLTLASSTDIKSKQLSNLTQALTIDLKATTNTNIIELNAVTKSKTATITASAISTQVPNNYLPGGSIPVTVVQNATYPTDWTITLGDADTPIPQGKVTLTITVSNTGTASDKTYNIAITKDEDSESRLESLVITNADGTATIWDLAFDKDTYRTFEYKNSSGSYIPGNYPQGTRATYSVSHTSKTGKPSISVQTMQTGAKIEIFYYQSGSYSTIASGTTSLTHDLLETTESIAYQIRITSKDTSIRRQYNITLSYEGADLSQIGDASVSDGTYTYTSENVTAPSPIEFSVTSLSENISIAVSGENSEGTALTFNPVEQDPSDSKQWLISAPAGNELTMGTNEITLDVTNTKTGLTQTYTYKLLYETAVLTQIDDIAETIDGVYEYNSTDITQGFATGWEFYITSSSEDVSISVSGQNSEGTALTLSTPTRDATNPKRWKISAPTGNGFTIGTNPIVITVTNTNSSDVKTYTYNIIRTQ